MEWNKTKYYVWLHIWSTLVLLLHPRRDGRREQEHAVKIFGRRCTPVHVYATIIAPLLSTVFLFFREKSGVYRWRGTGCWAGAQWRC